MHPLLHALTDFLPEVEVEGLADRSEPPPTYWYVGRCLRTGQELRLPRTALAERVAQGLMAQLGQDDRFAQEGKMFGVLLVLTPTGDRAVLKAFSGLLWGQSQLPGWVPPIPGREQVALAEAETLAALNRIRQELLDLQQWPVRQQHQALARDFAQQIQALAERHRQRKQARQAERARLQETLTGADLSNALATLEDESRRDGMARRDLKRLRDRTLAPLQAELARVDARIHTLKQMRKAQSHQLQTQFQGAYRLTNFAGESQTLAGLVPYALPTGTGDCCAPKLLHTAASLGFQPLALAEFWWGPDLGRVAGKFYGACADRCQPIMGFLLSGLFQAIQGHTLPKSPLVKIYADHDLIVVDKPPGLLSVPGRTAANQDSVLSRLQLEEDGPLFPVHRLDQDTSGLLVLARSPSAQRQLHRQFQHRLVSKTYEALLTKPVIQTEGTIALPLWGDPTCRPYQQVDFQRGKLAQTRFRRVSFTEQGTRLYFWPLTGRSHQIRVHAADDRGLGSPIRGDRLYGVADDRLYLHACELRFCHPTSDQDLHLVSPTPF